MASRGIIPSQDLQAGDAFLSAFSHYVRIDLSCKHISEDEPHALVKWLYSQAKNLCKSAVETVGSLEATLWRGLYVVSVADGTTSKETHQDRGCFLIGIKCSGAEDWVPIIAKALDNWEKGIRKLPDWADYLPVPILSACLVKQKQIGTMRIDEWMWPEALISGPLAFSKESLDGEESYTFLANADSTVNAPATTTSIKKLTPASAILNRLKWDSAFDVSDYNVVYEDRHDGLMEIGVDLWTMESTEEHFIPMHRIRSIKRKSTGQTVWHREERIDLISGGGSEE